MNSYETPPKHWHDSALSLIILRKNVDRSKLVEYPFELRFPIFRSRRDAVPPSNWMRTSTY